MYFLAIICPPLALLFLGKPVQAVLNIFLCLAGYFPGALHALAVVYQTKQDQTGSRHHADNMRQGQQTQDLMIMQMQLNQLQHMQLMDDPQDVTELTNSLPRHLRKRKARR